MAKEAVALDMTSGDSWYILGNAYIASFFRGSRAIKDLDRALQAYSRAVRGVLFNVVPIGVSSVESQELIC